MRTFVVLGVPRGGTSMIAGLLRIFGIHMGDYVDDTKHEALEFAGLTVDECIDLIEIRNIRDEDWGWKEPWIGLILNDIHNSFANPHYIYISRDLIACLNSDLRHNDTFKERENAESFIWNRNLHLVNEMNKVLRYADKKLLLSYEESLKRPENLIEQLETFIGKKLSKDKREQAIKFIKPGYRKIK